MMQWQKTYRLCEDAHWFWVLVSKEREQSSERTQTSSEENEEWQLLLGVNAHVMKR
jgi:hypothetical protein